ncbi:MAG: hypothetical protein LJE68_05685 [Rhodobacter sp.]|nr:hypothetical protein [Rhodobacter sp.]
MNRILTTIIVTAFLTSGTAYAKGHDQSGTEDPGADVGTETVSAAKTLGAALGNGKKPDAANGNSANAGRPVPQ